MLYNVVMVSAEQQSESAICIHIYPFLLSLPPLPHQTPFGHLRVPSSVPCAISSFPLAILNTVVYVYQYVCVCSPVSLQPLWTVACQAPLSMWFSQQEYWSGLPFPSPGDLPDLGIKPMSPVSPALQADSLPLSHQGSPYISMRLSQFVPPSPSPAGTGTLKIDWPVCRSFSPPGTEKAQLSLRSKSRTGKAAKFWAELGGEGRRGTRGGQIVSRRTTRGWGGWQMMKRVGLGWLYPGGCEFVTWQTQGGNELSGEPGWSAQANRKIYLTTSRTSLHKRPWWDISIGPRVWKCWPFSNWSVPVWGQTWGIAQISLYTIGCWKP